MAIFTLGQAEDIQANPDVLKFKKTIEAILRFSPESSHDVVRFTTNTTGTLEFKTHGTDFKIKTMGVRQELYYKNELIAEYSVRNTTTPLTFDQPAVDAILTVLTLTASDVSLDDVTFSESQVEDEISVEINSPRAPSSQNIWLLQILGGSLLVAGLALIFMGTWGGGLVPLLGGSATVISLGFGSSVMGAWALTSVGIFRDGGASHEETVSRAGFNVSPV